MDKEFTYRALFDQYAKPGETFGEEWIEEFDETIIEEGVVVGTHSWNSGNPGASAGVDITFISFGGCSLLTLILDLMGHTKDLQRLLKL